MDCQSNAGSVSRPEFYEAYIEAERQRKEEQKEAMLYRLGHRQRTYQLERLGKVGRNEKCPCGSGAKFKACCMRRSTK